MDRNKKIIIFGGAFNPPHHGHVYALKCALKHFTCDEAWIMPSANRWDKTIHVSDSDRISMIGKMLKDDFSDSKVVIKISRLEIDRKKETSTYETTKELKNIYPEHEFHYLIGEDSFQNIKKWIHGEELYKEANFLVVRRENKGTIKGAPENIIFLRECYPTKETKKLSSTHIRGFVRQKKNISEYVSPSIRDYIKNRGLYWSQDQ